MRCSHFGRPSKSNSSDTEGGSTNSQKILQDLNRHSWLLKKLKWEVKTVKNHKDFMDFRARTLAELLRINDVDVEYIGEESTVLDTPASLPVSLPVNLYNRLNRIGLCVRSRNNPTNDNAVNDNMTPDPRDVEVAYNEITKEFNKSLQVSEPSVQSGPFDVHIGEDPNNNYQQSRMSIRESPTSIKHHLPLATPPQRSKPSYNKNAPSTSGVLRNKINTVNCGVQTDDVIIINKNAKKVMDFITSKNINFEKLQAAMVHVDMNNSAGNPQAEGMMRDQVMQVLEACSIYNKEIIIYNNKVFTNVPEPELKIERIKLAYLRCMFEKIFGSVFEELAKSLQFDLNCFDPEIPDIVPRAINIRKRRLSSVSQQDSNGGIGDGTGGQNGPPSKRPTLRAQRRSPKATSTSTSTPTFMVPYEVNPQFTQTTRVLELETSYSNSHALNHMDYVNNQYPSPRRHYVQSAPPVESPMQYYNTSPRIMQPYPQMQFVREQQIPRQYSANYGNNLNYPPNCPDVTNNIHPHVNGVPLPAHVMPSPEQQNYFRIQAQRNAMHMSNYAGTWNKDVGPNGHIIM